MLKQLAKDYFNNMYHMPPNERDFEEFAKVVLNKFIQELEENKTSVVWNYGLDSVVFVSKEIENKESLQAIKERYFGDENDKSNSTKLYGTGPSGDNEADKTDNLENKQSKVDS